MNSDTRLFLFLNKFSGRSKAGNFYIAALGEYLAYALISIFLLSLFFYPLFNHNSLILEASVLFASLLSRFAFGTPLRFLLKRTRPHKIHRVHNVLSEESFSFPSGHSLFFFAFASILFFYSHVFGAIFFLGVCIMTLFRVVAGVHYPSDIAGGMLIGILSGILTFYFITPILQILFTS